MDISKLISMSFPNNTSLASNRPCPMKRQAWGSLLPDDDPPRDEKNPGIEEYKNENQNAGIQEAKVNWGLCALYLCVCVCVCVRLFTAKYEIAQKKKKMKRITVLP